MYDVASHNITVCTYQHSQGKPWTDDYACVKILHGSDLLVCACKLMQAKGWADAEGCC